MSSSSPTPTSDGGLTALLSALQSGVTAINSVINTMKSVFPSSS